MDTKSLETKNIIAHALTQTSEQNSILSWLEIYKIDLVFERNVSFCESIQLKILKRDSIDDNHVTSETSKITINGITYLAKMRHCPNVWFSVQSIKTFKSALSDINSELKGKLPFCPSQPLVSIDFIKGISYASIEIYKYIESAQNLGHFNFGFDQEYEPLLLEDSLLVEFSQQILDLKSDEQFLISEDKLFMDYDLETDSHWTKVSLITTLKLILQLFKIWDSNVYHGDISPSNILINSKLETTWIDFEFATTTFNSHIDKNIKGTPFHILPEYLTSIAPFSNGRHLITPHYRKKNDLYALMSTLHFCITGKRFFPSDADSISDFASEIKNKFPINFLFPKMILENMETLFKLLLKPWHQIDTESESGLIPTEILGKNIFCLFYYYFDARYQRDSQ